MQNRQNEVSILVNSALSQIRDQNQSAIIDHVFLEIERCDTLKSEYDNIILKRNQKSVNQIIGKMVRKATGMNNSGKSQKATSGLISAYTILE